MHLRNGESVLRIVKRDRTPYFLKILGILIVVVPIYTVLFSLYDAIGGTVLFVLFVVFSFFAAVVVCIVSLDYLLDKLILTNKRIVWVNWKSLFRKDEHEVELLDIQDVSTSERGIISKLPAFNYGLLTIETAASKTAIQFDDCPDPNAIEHFIIVQTEKLRTSTPMS